MEYLNYLQLGNIRKRVCRPGAESNPPKIQKKKKNLLSYNVTDHRCNRYNVIIICMEFDFPQYNISSASERRRTYRNHSDQVLCAPCTVVPIITILLFCILFYYSIHIPLTDQTRSTGDGGQRQSYVRQSNVLTVRIMYKLRG